MEIYAEKYEAALGLGMESTFGVFANPTLWVPGECKIKPEVGNRESKMAIGEWDETHISAGTRKADGSLAIQVCPGQEALFFGASGILTRRDRRHMRSFSVVQNLGDRESMRYRGVVVDKYTLKATRDEDLALDLDCKGVWGDPAPPATPNYSGLASAYILQELGLWIGGSLAVQFDSLDITGEHAIRDDIYGNQFYRQDMTTQSRKLSVKLAGYRDGLNALRTAYLNQSAVTMVAKWARGARSLQAAVSATVMTWSPDDPREEAELKPLAAIGGEAITWLTT